MKAIQDQIDALENEGKQSDRDDTVTTHNEKIKQLLKDRHYHELRTGVEHKKAIEDIDKQIAEEKRNFQKQQDDWARDDLKENLQAQIDEVEDAGEEERKRLEEYYKQVTELANKGVLDTLATLAATNPQWLETGKNWIKNLMDGISLMEPEFKALLERSIGAVTGFNSAMPAASSLEIPWQMSYNNNKDIWEQQSKQPGVDPGDRSTWTSTMVQAAQQNEAYRNQYGITDTGKLTAFAKGGPVDYTGLALVHQGEYILNASLVDAIKSDTLPPSSLSWGSGAGANNLLAAMESFAVRIEAAAEQIETAVEQINAVAIGGSLLHIEHYENNDGADPGILARELQRSLALFAGVKG